MNYTTKDLWLPSGGITLEENAMSAIKSNKNALVIAGPGAGKTELLAQKAGFLLETNTCSKPQKILAISFKKDAAENLKKRVVKRYGNEISNRFISMTYDAFFKRILDQFKYSLPEDTRPDENYEIDMDGKLIDEVFLDLGINSRSDRKKFRLDVEKEMINNVELPLKDNSDSSQIWSKLLKGFDEFSSILSFNMISLLVKCIIENNPMIKKVIQCTYSHAFLDEFQDTTKLQYSIVKTCFMNSKTIITAVGDNKQRIMLWAGAFKEAFEDFSKDFDSENFELLMNYRSAPKLVLLQQNMYSLLNEKEKKVRTAKKWKDDDGCIELLISEDEYEEAKSICKSIKGQVDNGVKPNDICILCKQLPEKYSKSIINELKNVDICARNEKDYQDLIKEPIISIIVDFLKLSLNFRSPDEWIRIKEFYENINYLDSDNCYDKYSKKLDNLSKELTKIKKNLYDIRNQDDLKTIVENILNFFGVGNIKSYFPEYKQGKYLDDNIQKFIKLFWQEYVNTNDIMKSIANLMGENSIPIMTIHKSKGLEYTSAYFIGLEDSAFWNFKNQPEEDRCAFFVALSRAKKFIMFTFSKKREMVIQEKEKIDEFYQLFKRTGIVDIIKIQKGGDYYE